MKEPEILSTLPPSAPLATSPGPVRALVFDACHVGVVWRAVWFVLVVLGVALLFAHPLGLNWLLEWAALTAVALPAVLLWLSLGCGAKTWLGRWPLSVQVAVGVGLGGLAGVFAAGLWVGLGLGWGVRWLASGLAGGLLAGVLVAGLVWRARAQLPAGTAARLTELQSRIRPHFLFNTLNSAIALVRAEPARAEALLEDLSELFRSALASPATDVTLAQELHLAERYLAIEQVRFGTRLRLAWSLDPRAHGARLPPLILQPLVENAVKHGVEPSAQGADIHIRTACRGDWAVLEVSNTVPAGSGHPGQGLALANVRERLVLLHDVHVRFHAGWVDGGVYRARLEVPLA